MLQELEQTIGRLLTTEPPNSLTMTLLSRHKENYASMIQRVEDCDLPRPKRILAEETLEAVDSIMYIPMADGAYRSVETTEVWNSYREAVLFNRELDLHYLRYRSAKCFVNLYLQHNSYMYEVAEPDYKSFRYSYALSGLPLPDWYNTGCLVPCLEEIVTAYCFMLLTILDYAEENPSSAVSWLYISTRS